MCGVNKHSIHIVFLKVTIDSKCGLVFTLTVVNWNLIVTSKYMHFIL